jgi:hypothetical protein
MKAIKWLSSTLAAGTLAISIGTAQISNPTYPDERVVHVRLQSLAAFNTWLSRYATSSGLNSDSWTIREGVALAKARQSALLALIQSDPALALANSVPSNLRKNLPRELLDQMEVPVSGTGDFLVLCAISPLGAPATDTIQRIVQLNGQTYHAFVYGRRLTQTTKYQIPLHGIALAGLLALDEKVLSELGSAEAPRFAESAIDLTKAAKRAVKSNSAPLARMGDQVYRFASTEHLQQSEMLLENAESGLRAEPSEPAAALLTQDGFAQAHEKVSRHPDLVAPGNGSTSKVLVIRADFSDLPGDPRPLGGGTPYDASSLQAIAKDQIATYYASSSYGKVSMEFTISTQLYRMPQTAAEYASAGSEFQLYRDAVAAATTDYSVTNFDKVVTLFSWLGAIPGSLLQFGGLTVIGTSMVWVNGEFDFRVVAHELGHTFGLYHANFWKSTDGNPISDSGSSQEYSDPFDTMGANWANDPRTDFNPWFKTQLQWISDVQVQTVTDSGIYRVFRFDDAAATGTLALKVVKDANRTYWIGYRRNFWDNPAMQNGAYVIWGYNYPRQSDLLDLGPTANNPRDPALVIGETLADSEANLSITPVDEGGDAPAEYLDVQISFGPPPLVNTQPQAQAVFEGEPAQFTVVATGNPPPIFVWQRLASGSSTWVDLSDADGYSGSATSTLVISTPTAEMDGDLFRCVLTNSDGGFNSSQPVALNVHSSQSPLLRMNSVDGQLVLSWPTSAKGFVLETTSELSPTASWVAVTNQIEVVGGSFVVSYSLGKPAGFFRLNKE